MSSSPSCPRCATAAPAGALYCSRCGTKLQAPATPGYDGSFWRRPGTEPPKEAAPAAKAKGGAAASAPRAVPGAEQSGFRNLLYLGPLLISIPAALGITLITFVRFPYFAAFHDSPCVPAPPFMQLWLQARVPVGIFLACAALACLLASYRFGDRPLTLWMNLLLLALSAGWVNLVSSGRPHFSTPSPGTPQAAPAPPPSPAVLETRSETPVPAPPAPTEVPAKTDALANDHAEWSPDRKALEKRWVRYLNEIQEDKVHPNWSGRPLDLYTTRSSALVRSGGVAPPEERDIETAWEELYRKTSTEFVKEVILGRPSSTTEDERLRLLYAFTVLSSQTDLAILYQAFDYLDAGGQPTPEFSKVQQEFPAWAAKNARFVEEHQTPEKAREYLLDSGYLAVEDTPRPSDPIAEFSAALRRNPSNPWAYAGRARSQESQNRLDEAAADYDKAKELCKTRLLSYPPYPLSYRLARLEEHCEYRRAELIYRKGDPAGAFERLGATYVGKTGDVCSALDLLLADQAVETAPKDPAAYVRRASLQILWASWKRALEDLDQALGLAPSNASALTLRARVKMEMADAKGAWADAEEAVRAAPQDPQGLVLQGDLKFMSFAWEEAVERYDEAQRRKLLTSADVQFLKGRVQFARGNWKSAVQDFEAAKTGARYGDDAHAWHYLARRRSGEFPGREGYDAWARRLPKEKAFLWHTIAHRNWTHFIPGIYWEACRFRYPTQVHFSEFVRLHEDLAEGKAAEMREFMRSKADPILRSCVAAEMKRLGVPDPTDD